MAFTTVPGASASDATSYVGTSGIDSLTLSAGAASNVFVGSQQANDTITLQGAVERTTHTIKGGQGNDVVSFGGGTLTRSFLNGNKDTDTFGSAADLGTLSTTTLQGGQGTDSIFIGSATDSIINGNKQADTITLATSLSGSE
ncbi:hypothetical protein, partial [Prochlorococcus sp. P1344]